MFYDLVKKRKSVRIYLDNPVEKEKIEQCIEAARLAPSAENVQPWSFIIIDDIKIKEEFCKKVFSGIYSTMKFPGKAPVIIIALAKPDILANKLGAFIQGTQYYLLDMGIAGEHIALQAAELGLGTCWIGWFNEKEARKFLNVPSDYKIVYLITLGYPGDTTASPRKKKELKEIISYNGLKDWKIKD